MRTGTSDVKMDGLPELGFLLGGAMQNKEVQQAFGFSRAVAEAAKPPLISAFLPRFFGATGKVLEENVRSVLALLYDDMRPDRSAYMLLRRARGLGRV